VAKLTQPHCGKDTVEKNFFLNIKKYYSLIFISVPRNCTTPTNCRFFGKVLILTFKKLRSKSGRCILGKTKESLLKVLSNENTRGSSRYQSIHIDKLSQPHGMAPKCCEDSLKILCFSHDGVHLGRKRTFASVTVYQYR
jgi:hypothetical protein